jgi:N-hydroxyarylamine O-acetyltransferase
LNTCQNGFSASAVKARDAPSRHNPATTTAAMLTPTQVRRYLERIRYQGGREPALATLRALHRANLFSVPRYELNGLFAALLEALGFTVARLAGRVGPQSIDFDHMVLRVDLDEPFLADVGFGDCFVLPLRLDQREPQDGGDGKSYRLSADPEGLLLDRREGTDWKRQYAFAAKAWPLAAFEPGCQYHESSPDSHFTQNTAVSLATPSGRVTLSERRLIRTESGVRREELLASDEQVRRTLEQVFEIQ